jgi:hypothetical protein
MPDKQSSLEKVTDAVFGPRALHVDDAVKLNRRHRLQALLDFNSMKDATVTGILSEGRVNADGSGFPFWITDLQTADGNIVKEPLTESDRDLSDVGRKKWSPTIRKMKRTEDANGTDTTREIHAGISCGGSQDGRAGEAVGETGREAAIGTAEQSG